MAGEGSRIHPRRPISCDSWLSDGANQVKFPEFSDDEAESIELPPEFLAAFHEAHRGRKVFYISQRIDLEAMQARFNGHPDLRVLSHWISKRSEDADELAVMFWLSVMVISEWEFLPKITLTEHRKIYKKIMQSCSELSDLLTRTRSEYRRGGGWGMMYPRVMDLLTEDEMDAVNGCMKNSENTGNHMELSLALPTVDTLLARLEKAADRLAKKGPIHTQTKKNGAIRGYFVRRIGELFRGRYNECPAEVIAVLTTLALDQETDRELVGKLIKQRAV